MKISTKLIWFFLGVVGLFCGLSIVLLGQMNAVCNGYDRLIEGAIRQADSARITQVDFKKQVQEWKDILLRGHNPEDLAKYTKQFQDKQTQVRTEAQLLGDTLDDPAARSLIGEFLTAHAALATKYQRALDHYLGHGFDFKGADKLVRGQDRPPTNLFDQVVGTLDQRVQQAVAAQKIAVGHQRNLALVVAGALLGLLGLAGLVIVRGIVGRLRSLKEVSDRLARADVAGLAIDISGHDEVGEFGESMKGVHAAIEELSALAAARSIAS